MNGKRDPAPVASLDDLTVTQHNDLLEVLGRCRNAVEREVATDAFLRGVASERDAGRSDNGTKQ